MKSRASVPRDYLHISTLQAIDNNEGTTFKHNTKYQTSQKLNKKM
ncbi:hypothetical protein [Shewanella woodyi]|nr:hypothetical protein [Shewanella woodyi]